MPKKPHCPVCTALLFAYINALQEPFNELFVELGLSGRATPNATWKRYGGHCVYCGQEADWALRTRSRDPNKQAVRNLNVGHSPQIDHWIPISRGGPPTVWNMLLSCRQCNISKSNSLQPYPPALLSDNENLARTTTAALKLAKDAWGELLLADDKAITTCGMVNYLSARWQDGKFTFGGRFSKLSEWLDQWTPSHCKTVTVGESNRMITTLELETERERSF